LKKEKPEQCSGLFDGTGIFCLPVSFFSTDDQQRGARAAQQKSTLNRGI
jgi:hypothetical protein